MSREQVTFNKRDDGQWEALATYPDQPAEGYTGESCLQRASKLMLDIDRSLKMTAGSDEHNLWSRAC